MVVDAAQAAQAVQCLHTAFGLDSDSVFEETQLSAEEIAAKMNDGRVSRSSVCLTAAGLLDVAADRGTPPSHEPKGSRTEACHTVAVSLGAAGVRSIPRLLSHCAQAGPVRIPLRQYGAQKHPSLTIYQSGT